MTGNIKNSYLYEKVRNTLPWKSI